MKNRIKLYGTVILLSSLIAYAPRFFGVLYDFYSPISRWVEYTSIKVESPQIAGNPVIPVVSYSKYKEPVKVTYTDELRCSYDEGKSFYAVGASVFPTYKYESDYLTTGDKWELHIQLPSIDSLCFIRSSITIHPENCSCVKRVVVESNKFLARKSL